MSTPHISACVHRIIFRHQHFTGDFRLISRRASRDRSILHLRVCLVRFALLSENPVNSFAASGSGSVIGRDPLPPRAVSTSHLPQRTLTQPPTVVSTLPLPRNSTAGHRQQPLPLHHSTPQHQSLRQLEDEAATSQMLRAASNGDIGRGPGM